MLQGTQGKVEWHSWNEWGWIVSIFFLSHIVENVCDVGDLWWRSAWFGNQKSRLHLYCPKRPRASVSWPVKRRGWAMRFLQSHWLWRSTYSVIVLINITCHFISVARKAWGNKMTVPWKGVFVDGQAVTLFFGARSERSSISLPLLPGASKGKSCVGKGGDFSLRKLGLTEQGMGCYYQTLMAPDKG